MINLKLMEKYFVCKLGFESVKGENFYEIENIEEELYLRKPGVGYISIVKYKDDDEYEMTMQGNSNTNFWDYKKYVAYFMNKSLLEKEGEKTFIDFLDEEIRKLEND